MVLSSLLLVGSLVWLAGFGIRKFVGEKEVIEARSDIVHGAEQGGTGM